MGAANYGSCLAITLKWEGGDANDPHDPGKATRKGVTQAAYDDFRRAHGLAKRSVFQMTDDEVLLIYRTRYWDAVKGDTLANGVDLATWDYGVNSGPARSRKDLLSVAGGSDKQTVQKLCAKRLGFLKGLKTWAYFGKGWGNRVADIEARAVKMTLTAAANSPDEVKAQLQKEAESAAVSAKRNSSVASASAGGSAISTGAGVGTAAASTPPEFWAYLALGGVVAVLVVVMIVAIARSRQHEARAAAYLSVAKEV